MKVEYSYLLIFLKRLIILSADFLSVKNDIALFQICGMDAEGNLCKALVRDRGS